MGTCPSGNEPTQRRAFCYFTTKTIYLNTRALLSMFVLSNTLPYSTPSASSPARRGLRHTRPIQTFPSGNKTPRRKRQMPTSPASPPAANPPSGNADGASLTFRPDSSALGRRPKEPSTLHRDQSYRSAVSIASPFTYIQITFLNLYHINRIKPTSF